MEELPWWSEGGPSPAGSPGGRAVESPGVGAIYWPGLGQGHLSTLHGPIRTASKESWVMPLKEGCTNLRHQHLGAWEGAGSEALPSPTESEPREKAQEAVFTSPPGGTHTAVREERVWSE